jgi:hypothetical protein
VTPVVRLVDETSPESAFTWKFTVIDGSPEAAIAEAHSLNLEPDVKLEPVPKKSGCSTMPVEAVFALAAVSMMLWMRRPGRA